jgi:hypothetical protein
MAYKKWTLRILRDAALTALAVIPLTFAAVQFQQRLLHYHAERLFAQNDHLRGPELG